MVVLLFFLSFFNLTRQQQIHIALIYKRSVRILCIGEESKEKTSEIIASTGGQIQIMIVLVRGSVKSGHF